MLRCLFSISQIRETLVLRRLKQLRVALILFHTAIIVQYTPTQK